MPEREYDSCLRYELAREINEYISYFGISIDAANDRAGRLEDFPNDVFPEEAYMYVRLMFPQHDIIVDHLPAQYPIFLWQDLPAIVRERIVDSLQGEILGLQSYDPGPLHGALDIELQRRRGKDIQSFLIDWKQSNTSLINDFQKWLEDNRPLKVPVTIHRGQQSLRDALNAITAMRLRHHYRSDEADAITGDAFGKSLYNGTFAWDRAASRGVELFKALFPNAGEPKSAIRKPNLRGRPRQKRMDKVIERVKAAYVETQLFEQKMKGRNSATRKSSPTN